MKVGILGSGDVAKALAVGFLKHGHEVMLGARDASKLRDWRRDNTAARVGLFADAAQFGQLVVLAVKGNAAAQALRAAGAADLAGKTVIDATNPVTDDPPVNGVHTFFTSLDESLMERFQRELVDLSSVGWQDRAHFYAVSARIMRGILVDAARARRSQKRGGLLRRIDSSTNFSFDQVPDMGSGRAAEILAINDALDCLARMDPRQAQVVEMRFFVGLSVDETAEVLKISPQSVMRDWKLAKAWLRRETKRREA